MIARLFAPGWAGGWAASRVAFATVMALSLAVKAPNIADAYASADMVFDIPPFHMSRHIVLTPPTAWAVWTLGMLGLAGVARGGRTFRPGLFLWFLANLTLLASEALNIKAHDRLSAWIALALLVSPNGENDLCRKARSPAPRWFLMLIFCGIYGSTGWLKILKEPGWWSGRVLAYHLVDQEFAGGTLAAWVSGQRWLCMPMSWMTLVFEASFPLLIWFRRTNPWLLALGATMHVGIGLLMQVGKFNMLALCAYPALLHPSVAALLWRRISAAMPARTVHAPPPGDATPQSPAVS